MEYNVLYILKSVFTTESNMSHKFFSLGEYYLTFFPGEKKIVQFLPFLQLLQLHLSQITSLFNRGRIPIQLMEGFN